jgi:hypothetical protein
MSELTAVVVKYIQQEIKQTTTYSMQHQGKFRKLKLLIKTMKLLLLQLVEKQKYKQYQKN